MTGERPTSLVVLSLYVTSNHRDIDSNVDLGAVIDKSAATNQRNMAYIRIVGIKFC